MGDEQKTLRANFPVFIAGARGHRRGRPRSARRRDLLRRRGGGARTDSCKGRAIAAASLSRTAAAWTRARRTSWPPTGRGTRTYTGDLAGAFSCLADLGTGGLRLRAPVAGHPRGAVRHQPPRTRASCARRLPGHHHAHRRGRLLGRARRRPVRADHVPAPCSLRCATWPRVRRAGGPRRSFRAPLASCTPFQRIDDPPASATA
jgi:hypothetical protein